MTWDFDSNGKADALTDGLLLLRHMFDLRGTMLVDSAISVDSEISPTEIEEAVAKAYSIADIDGNGAVDALTDGMLLMRYLFGRRGDMLTEGVVDPQGASRTSAEILTYIESYMPVQ